MDEGGIAFVVDRLHADVAFCGKAPPDRVRGADDGGDAGNSRLKGLRISQVSAHHLDTQRVEGSRIALRPNERSRLVLGDDPEMASFYESSGRLQRDGYRIVVDTLAPKRPLRTGLSPEDATTILPVLLGTDVYRSMLEDHGWAEQKWRAWVIETLSEALFGRPAAG